MIFNLGSKFFMSVLHIAQKNSIAKQVAHILSNGSKRTGNTLSKFNPVFHFELNNKQHIFSSVRGHLFDYQLPPQCKNWNTYDNKKILTRDVPMIQKIGPGMDDLFSNLEHLARGKQKLILWLDCDRQGEAIAFEVIKVIAKVNPKIKIERARFAAVTQRDIMTAYQNLVQPNKLEADAVNYRIQIDFRMGCAFTRYQSTAFQKRFVFKQHSVVSYGPCQIPTLGFVVNRYLQIFNFKPQKYWIIKGSIVLDEKTNIQLKSQRGSIKDQTQANIIFHNMYKDSLNEQQMVQGKILQRNKNQKKKYRPYPLTTVAFQKLATDKLKMSSAQAMKIAEKLYMNGFISYPRTETNAFPSSINPINIVKRFQDTNTYSNYVKQLVENGKYMKPKSGNQNDQAHTPIHPVKSADRNALSPQQWKVYDLIMRHFLACCSKDAIGIQSQIIGVIGKEYFRASHLHIKQKNYLEIYPFDRWAESSFPGQIPNIFYAQIQLKESKTQAPGYLSESDLITLMQKNQIGTDSTIHQHIETIQHRKYAIKSNNTFKPTNLGASLIITYKQLGIQLQNCHIRRLMQQRINKIAEGSIERNSAVLQTLEQVKPIYQRLKQIENEWINKMQISMKKHQQLTNIEMQQFGQNNNIPQNNHFNLDSNDLSENNQNTVQPKFICYFCKKPGHVITNCPEKKSNSANHNNNNLNNISEDKNKKNKKPKKQKKNNSNEKIKKAYCFNCKGNGHSTEQCPKNKGNFQNKQQQQQFRCFICQKEGHFAPSCPERKNNKNKFQQ